MKLKIFPALCALLWLSCGEVPTAPEMEQEATKHFINYEESWGSFTFQDYPNILEALDSAQAFFDSTMGDNEPITIQVHPGERDNKWDQCPKKGNNNIIACAEKGVERIIITGRKYFDLQYGSVKWWRMIILHETFHYLGKVGHWDPPRGTLMDSHPTTDEIHPELWEIMRQEGWSVNDSNL